MKLRVTYVYDLDENAIHEMAEEYWKSHDQTEPITYGGADVKEFIDFCDADEEIYDANDLVNVCAEVYTQLCRQRDTMNRIDALEAKIDELQDEVDRLKDSL